MNGDWYYIKVSGNLNGDNRAEIVLSYQQVGDSEESESDNMLALGQAWIDQVMPAFRAILNVNWIASAMLIRKWSDPTIGAEISLVGLDGQVAGQSQANQTAAIVSWKTAKIGRSYRGRTYVPAVSENSANGSSLEAGYLVNLTAWAAACLTLEGEEAFGWALGIWSRVLEEGNVVTSFTPRTITGVQRRRRPGVGI